MLKYYHTTRFDEHVQREMVDGKVVILPTDTIYGMSCSVKFPDTVEEVYDLRKRSLNKPFIVLISSLDDLDFFGISLLGSEKDLLEKIWPGPVSVVIDVANSQWRHIHRGHDSIVFRMPKHEELRSFISKVGPIISTSVNPEGMKPAKNIPEAKMYFGDKISCYVDFGEIEGLSSTIIALGKEGVSVLRQGDWLLPGDLLADN